MSARFTPADDGGLAVEVRGGPLSLQASTVRVEGSLAVEGSLLLGEPATAHPLADLLAGLRQEINALKAAATAPARTTLWVHGSGVRIIGTRTARPPRSRI